MIQVITIGTPEFQHVLAKAYLQGAKDMRELLDAEKKEEPLETSAMMEHLGIKTHPSFRKLVKQLSIKPIRRGREKYYNPSWFNKL